MNKKEKYTKISLPCLRGRMGDWFYYISLMSFKEISVRVKLPEEINKYYKGDSNLRLNEWIQRKLDPRRTREIVDYLSKQKQRFFNSLILGIYEGNPTWQDIEFKENNLYDNIPMESLKYFSRSFGILTLNGDEDIFAIDGQHRAIGIREAVKENNKLKDDEISVIFVAHSTSEKGMIRTRRLFSTLNKYAKPVSPADIIALSEDNNVALITRELTDNWTFLSGKVAVNKNRSISPFDKKSLTNILILADIIKILTTNAKIVGITTKGHNQKTFTETRESDNIIAKETQKVKDVLIEMKDNIPSISKFYNRNTVNRANNSTSLLFRPIGQMIYFSVYKICDEKGKKDAFYEYFKKDSFNLNNKVWKKIFWDEETETIITEKSRQRYAILLLLDYLGVKVARNKKDQEIFNLMKIDSKKLV